MRVTLVTALVAIACLASVPADASQRPLRGAIVTCPRWGPIWGTPAMAASLDELKRLGANAVAIHPYGWVKRDGRVEFRPAATLEFLQTAVRYSRERQLELFWKPHLGYWGQFEWRGSIQFGDDDKAWRRFFDDYSAFIVDQAKFAESHGIGLFAVGVELEATTEHERAWRSILAKVRQVYTGRILYAANWDKLDRVPFWDAVDLIGVHAYFPISDLDSPATEDLLRGWDQPLEALRALSDRHRKPVLFAEIGYNVNRNAAREPWAYRIEDSPENRDLRVRLMAAAIERVEAESFVAGMFWWKWMPGSTFWRRNFSLRDPEARAVLESRWASSTDAASAVAAD